MKWVVVRLFPFSCWRALFKSYSEEGNVCLALTKISFFHLFSVASSLRQAASMGRFKVGNRDCSYTK